MELGAGTKDRYKKITFWKEAIDELLVKIFLESYEQAPEQIILDVDSTDLPLHGKQEGRFFHGYYDSYCYLPLYIFCGEQVLLSGVNYFFRLTTIISPDQRQLLLMAARSAAAARGAQPARAVLFLS